MYSLEYDIDRNTGYEDHTDSPSHDSVGSVHANKYRAFRQELPQFPALLAPNYSSKARDWNKFDAEKYDREVENNRSGFSRLLLSPSNGIVFKETHRPVVITEGGRILNTKATTKRVLKSSQSGSSISSSPPKNSVKNTGRSHHRKGHPPVNELIPQTSSLLDIHVLRRPMAAESTNHSLVRFPALIPATYHNPSAIDAMNAQQFSFAAAMPENSPAIDSTHPDLVPGSFGASNRENNSYYVPSSDTRIHFNGSKPDSEDLISFD
jgi:hypothetical protein